MTDLKASDRDVSRAIRSWLHEDRHEDASRIAGAVLDHVEATPRRRATWWPAWRMPVMNKIVAIGLGAAAVVVLVLVGAQLFGSPTGGIGSQTTPSPEPTATPQPSVEPTSSAGAFLPEGTFLVQDVGAPADAPRITVTIPAPGWTSIPDFGGLIKGPDEDPPQSAMLLWAWLAGATIDVYGDPCHWASSRRTPATTVDELAAALAAQPSRDASDPVDVTVGGYAGKHVILHVPEDWDASSNDCDQGNFASYGVSGGEPARTHQGGGQIDELWILDVDGKFAILDAMYRPDTPVELIEEMRSIAESAAFELP